MNRSMVFGTCLFMGLAFVSARAQEGVLAEMYGQGVHAYFSRDLQSAHELFTSAITQGSRDPRCYYYRGLTYALLGRPDEAEADFRTGAEVEIKTADRVYPIADSLQRVQGRARMQIEKHRRVARLTYHAQATEIQKARYEQMKRAEQEVVRNRGTGAASAVPAAPATGEAGGTVAAPPASASDPFAAGAEAMPEKAPEQPAAPAVAPAATAEADPFAAPGAAAPATTAPATAAPATDAETNPFEDDKGAMETPAAPATPAPATPAAEGDDPFK